MCVSLMTVSKGTINIIAYKRLSINITDYAECIVTANNNNNNNTRFKTTFYDDASVSALQ